MPYKNYALSGVIVKEYIREPYPGLEKEEVTFRKQFRQRLLPHHHRYVYDNGESRNFGYCQLCLDAVAAEDHAWEKFVSKVKDNAG